jgi:CRP-like cAMP-binding protein
MNPPRNLILRKLSRTAAEAVLAAAEFIHLDLREYIIESNKPIKFVDFPETGVMSLLTPMDDGSLIEIATIGNEGMVGVPLVMGVSAISELVFCQVVGTAWRIPAEKFMELLREHEDLGSLCGRYAMTLFDQTARNAGCYRLHSIEERCARWLLWTQDRCGSDEFTLTQEFLANMLGVSRTGVNLAAGILSKGKLITYARGKIRVLNRAGLEEACCDCYASMQSYYVKVMGA